MESIVVSIFVQICWSTLTLTYNDESETIRLVFSNVGNVGLVIMRKWHGNENLDKDDNVNDENDNVADANDNGDNENENKNDNVDDANANGAWFLEWKWQYRRELDHLTSVHGFTSTSRG